MAILKEGTKITCPMCGDVMAKTKRDVYRGEKLSSEAFTSCAAVVGHGLPCVCPICKAPFITTKIHTEAGWV